MPRFWILPRSVGDWIEDEILYRIRPRILLIWLIIVMVMAILGFAPIHLPFWDKAVHTLSFTLLTTVSFFVWDGRRFWVIVITGISMLFISIISEYLQGYLPYRTFDGYDILANLIGSSIGLILAVIIDTRYRQRRARLQADYLMLSHHRDWADTLEEDSEEEMIWLTEGSIRGP
jgi:hypothetical protein